jgi:hypothetical protein
MQLLELREAYLGFLELAGYEVEVANCLGNRSPALN